jgi:hypothetical protein
MNDQVAALARSVLYEGYVLWPYRRTALKNQRRWTFGGVYPAEYTTAGHPEDACAMRTECLVEASEAVDLSISVRFLHVVDRRLSRRDDEDFVDRLSVRGVDYVSWQEAVERAITLHLPDVDLHYGTRQRLPFAIEPGVTREPLPDDTGYIAGWIVRSWEAIAASVDVRVAPLSSGVARISVEIRNHSAWGGGSRDVTQRRTLVATHTVLHTSAGRFISLTDPPQSLAEHVAACKNVGTWPVLVGTPPARDTMLSSPIILYDYPQAAPESSDESADAAGIDPSAALNVLTMTEDEQERVSEADSRTREIFGRCRAMSEGGLSRSVGRRAANDRPDKHRPHMRDSKHRSAERDHCAD